MPVCTSSTTSSAPWASQAARAAWSVSSGTGLTPPSPCTTSTQTAQVSSSTARLSASGSSWRHVGDPAAERLERRVLLGVAREQQRAEQAAVEAAEQADDLDLRGIVRRAVTTGELDRALVGLGAGVAEEREAVGPAQRALQALRQRDLRRGVEQVADVGQGPGLLRDGLRDRRVGVAEAGHRQAAEEVEVAPAVGVDQPGALAADERPRAGGGRSAAARRPRGRRSRSHLRAAGARGHVKLSSSSSGRTIVPMPASVKISSSRACSTRPSRRWALLHAALERGDHAGDLGDHAGAERPVGQELAQAGQRDLREQGLTRWCRSARRGPARWSA